MALLSQYTPVLHGLSFDLDPAGAPAAARAYLVQTAGSSALVSLSGTGTWTVEILGSADGTNFTTLATRSMPGQWRFDTKGLSALAVRVIAFTSGTISGGVLAHGAPFVTTNVSPLFGAFLVFSYNATPTEPPIGNQLRANATAVAAVTKVWIANTTNDGTDQFQALRKIPHGGTLLIQDRAKHADAALYRVTAPPVDKTDYVELAVSYLSHIGALAAGQVLVAVFNPGPVISLVGPVFESEFALPGSDAPKPAPPGKRTKAAAEAAEPEASDA